MSDFASPPVDPFRIVVDAAAGSVQPEGPTLVRRLSDLAGLFRDEQAWRRDLEADDRLVYQVLEEEYGVRLVQGRRVVEAAQAGARLARLLGVRRSDPLLVLRSVSVGEHGRPVESFVAFHRGDRSRFEVEVRRQKRGRRGNPLMVVTDGGARV